MEITTIQQIQQLFLSCGMGFILGAYYDIFRVIRLIMRSGKKWIFAQDIFFFLTSAVFTFLFSLAVMDGMLRLYLFLGEAVGFAAYYYTIGRLVMRFAGTVISVILKLWNLLWWLILFPFRLLAKALRRPVQAIGKLLKKLAQKTLTNFKKVLKQAPSLLYNYKKRKKFTPRVHTEGEINHNEGR